MAKKKGNMLGSWAFLIGVILALVIALFGTLTSTMVVILAILGLIVGFLNVNDEEVQPFLMSGVVLIIASAFGQQFVSRVPLIGNIFEALLVVFVPATIIVALKNVFSMARR